MATLLGVLALVFSLGSYAQFCEFQGVFPEVGKAGQTLVFQTNLLTADWEITGPGGTNNFVGSSVSESFNEPGHYRGFVIGPNACEEVIRKEFEFQIYPSLQSVSVQINQGAEFTNVHNVELNLSAPGALEVLISTNRHCRTGSWRPMVGSVPWIIDFSNVEGHVYAQFRTPVETSSCVSDSIVHDDQPPQLRRVGQPDGLTNDLQAVFQFQGDDGSSGFDTVLCRLNEGEEAPCNLVSEFQARPGDNTLWYRGRDIAGNTSTLESYLWTVDIDPPVARLLEHPDRVTQSTEALFTFDASGEDVAQFYCFMDQGLEPCVSPKVYKDLERKTHLFSVIAEDFAGNRSDPVLWQWEVVEPSYPPPVIAFTSVPDPVLDVSQAQATFQVENPGAGIEKFFCLLDQEDPVECESPFVMVDLPEGPHQLVVWALDQQNVSSNRLVTSWEVVFPKPEVVFTKTPPLETTLLEAEFAFESDSVVGIDHFECATNGSGYQICESPIRVTRLVYGVNTFFVKAIDRRGKVSDPIHYTWKVFKAPDAIKDSFVSAGPKRKLDLLLVMDNSDSMKKERSRRELVNNFRDFFKELSGLDWRMALITTDVRQRGGATLGRFIPWHPWRDLQMDASTDNPNRKLINTLLRLPEGSNSEKAIEALNLSLENPTQRNFFRDEAVLMGLIVSDEDEGSRGQALKDINQPEHLMKRIESIWGPSKAVQFHGVVWDPTVSRCHSATHKGRVYSRLIQLTGGKTHNICEGNYGKGLEGFADLARSGDVMRKLKCVPENGEVKLSYHPEPFKRPVPNLSGHQLRLSPAPPKGTRVDLEYACARHLPPGINLLSALGY